MDVSIASSGQGPAMQANASGGATFSVGGSAAAGFCFDENFCRAEVALAEFLVVSGRGVDCGNVVFLLDFLVA